MSSDSSFALDPRLEQDSLLVGDGLFSRVLLMNDSRYPWLILVPRRPGAIELTDLSEKEAGLLWKESLQLCHVLKKEYPEGKLNVGMLGNVVSQLHLHHVIRHEKDPAWPGPVWGHSAPEPYAEVEGQELAGRFSRLLGCRVDEG